MTDALTKRAELTGHLHVKGSKPELDRLFHGNGENFLTLQWGGPGGALSVILHDADLTALADEIARFRAAEDQAKAA